MLVLPRERVIIRDRQRKQITSQAINEKKISILERGLIHAPVVTDIPGSEDFLLLAGEVRTRAMDKIAEEKLSFLYDGQLIEPGSIPVTVMDAGSLLEQKEVEFDENIIRLDLTWQERATALADIHKLRLERNPEQTVLQTSIELTARSNSVAKTPSGFRKAVTQSLLIAENLSNPAISKARNANEAHQLILKQEEERVNSILAQRRIAALPSRPDLEVRKGDLLLVLPQVDAGNVDLICADPPYGIGAGGGGFRSRTIHHHNYEDDVPTARAIAQCILTEGFRVCKSRANLFLFTDIKHWDWLQLVSAQIGWTPFRRPLIWGKSDSEGLAPWGSQGPRITTEFIFFATKGEKGLLASPIDYLRVNRVSRSERIHAAEKPVELLRRLIECATLPGDFVLDPCCGSGSTLIACRETQRRGLGIEKDDDYFNTAMSNVHGGTDDGVS